MPRRRRAVSATSLVRMALVLAGSTFAAASSAPAADAIEVIESGNVSSAFVGLALDASSVPHVVYVDRNNGDIRYARREGGVWTIETAVAGTGSDGIAFGVSPNGDAHVLFRDTPYVRYANRSGGVWTAETLGLTPGEIAYGATALAVDSQGNPHVAYWLLICDIDCDAYLWYARKGGGSWIYEFRAYCLFEGGATELSLDESDSRHFVWGCPFFNEFQYYGPEGGEQVDGVDPYSGVAFDATTNGGAHVLYASGNSLLHQWKSGESWATEFVTPAGPQTDGSVSLALDGSGDPRAAYYDDANDDLRYACKDGGLWSIRVIDGEGLDVGSRTAIAVDGDGLAHIAYFDATNNAARYALVSNDATGVPLAGAAACALHVAPNPSVGVANIAFRLDRSEAIDLAIYDVSGRKIRTLAAGRLSVGVQSVLWDRKDDSMREAPAGVYFARLTSLSGSSVTERLTLLK